MPVGPGGEALPYPDTIQVGGGGGGGAAPDERIRQIVQMATQILGEDGLDDTEKVFIAQISQLAQKLLGARQKEMDGLAQGKVTPSAVRTSVGG